MFKKNTAVTGFQIGHFIGIADGIAVTTGTPACKLLLDGTPGTLTNAASYDATAGVWKIDLAAGDMNGDMVGLSFTLAACLPISYTIRTGTKLVSDLNDAAASNDWSAGEREQLRYRLQIDGTQTAPADTDLPSVNVTTLADGALIAIADAILTRDFSAVTGAASRSLLNAVRFLRNRWFVSGPTLTVTEEDDTTAAWTALLTTDETANPITGSDPG